MKIAILFSCLTFTPLLFFGQDADSVWTAPMPSQIVALLRDSGKYDPNQLKTGYWKQYFISGFASSRLIPLVYDSLVKIDSLYSPTTFYRAEGVFEANQKSGAWKTFVAYDLTNPIRWRLSATVSYANDLKQGEELVYDGSIICHNYYKQGKPDSISTCYAGGRLVSVQPYRDGKPHGSWISYDDEGKLLMEIVYENGRETRFVSYLEGFNDYPLGIQKAYYPDGSLKSEGLFEVGVPHGLHKSYYANGLLENEVEFDNGVVHGSHKTYYPNGKLQRMVVYSSGKPWTAGEAFSPKGKKLYAGDLKDGTGTLYLYDNRGRINEIQRYSNGSLIWSGQD